MKCTGRRLVAYTVVVFFLSYIGFSLTNSPTLPEALGAHAVVKPAPGATREFLESAQTQSSIVPRIDREHHSERGPPSPAPKREHPPPPRAPAEPPTPELSPPPHPFQPPPPVPSEADATTEAAPSKRAAGKYVKPKSAKPEDNQLTPELVSQYAENKVVMVTWANHHYSDFVKNWVMNVRKCGITNFMVGAMDDELLVKLFDAEVPTFAMQSGMTTQDFGWGTANFHKMGRKKIELIYLFTEMGFDILVSDVDTAWLRNPMPYLAKFPQADVLTSSDHLSNTAEGDSLEHPQKAMSAANIGIMLLRSSAKELAKQWVQVLEQDDKVWDQNAFNDLYRMGSSKGDFDKDRVFEGYNGKLKIGILPVATFASGHTYFVQRMHEKVKQDPYVIHATFQFSGTEGKRHRLREALVWADPPEYYDPPGGLLVYDADVPENLLKNATSVEGHFNLVNHQLLQVRSALALAQKLGRVLVMPKLYCGFDRWWAPHEGRIPGSQTTLPYLCPMDHVFEVESWLRPQPEEEFGDFIDFREYSFFDNDGVPESVKSSEVVVELVHSCSDGTCTQGTGGVAPADIKKVVAPKNLTDVDAMELLREHNKTKVIRFSSMVGTFGGFVDNADAEKFSRRIKRYAAIWCCKAAHPGHIWYDMEFDVVPHTDRHMRTWDESNPWVPTTGP